jgi:PAS domain S-box-containing protein
MTTILVVDDEAVNRDIARTLLSRKGYTVLEASGGAEGLRTAIRARPDLVVTDMLMPDMDGYQLVRELRACPELAHTPVVFYTANYLESQARPLAEAYGVSQIVLRSEDPGRLIEAVNAALEREPPDGMPPLPADFDRHHAEVVNSALLAKVRDLQASERRFRVIAEASPVGIILTDRDASAVYVSPECARLLDQPAAELGGHRWLSFLDAGLQAGLLAQLRDGHREPVPLRAPLATRAGRKLWVDAHVRSIHDGEDQLTGGLVLLADATGQVEADERKRAEAARREREARQQLAERLDSLSRMAGKAAHQFNNIFAAGQAYLAFAVDAVDAAIAAGTLDAATGHLIRSDLVSSQDSGTRAAELSRRLLMFSGREPLRPTELDLNAVLREASTALSSTLPAGAELRLALAPSPLTIRADPAQLIQALKQIVTNAGEAMPTGGTCTITTAVPSPEDRTNSPHAAASVLITDTGFGMEQQIAGDAIEPFFSTKPGRGVGLGLTTAYGIIAQGGGYLSIDSVPGRGTAVRILLPAAREPASVPDPPLPATLRDGSRDHRTILLADDNPAMLKVTERILSGGGYLVITAADGARAMTAARGYSAPIDCLVTDVMMPVMNGRELAEQFTARYPGAPVIFTSGYPEAIITDGELLGPGMVVLTKPFSKADLLIAVNGALAHPPATANAT